MQATVANIEKLQNDDVKIVDIRLESEWIATGIVPNSHTITFFDERGGYDAEGFLEQIKAITPKNRAVALLCRTGSRTGMLAPFLEEKLENYTIYNLDGGIMALMSDGYKTVSFKG